MRLLRLLLPVVAILIMMFADRNQTALTVAYVLFGAFGLLFIIGFISERRRKGKHSGVPRPPRV